jgi:hypothetical protein
VKRKPIFSGPASRPFWKAIGAIKDERVFDAIYALGCKCQELEAEVNRLKGAAPERGEDA